MPWKCSSHCSSSAASRKTSVRTIDPESSATPFQCWLRRLGIKPIRIYPGSPWKNGYNERFNSTLRREVLNAEWSATKRHAQVVLNSWLEQYNHIRPHQALSMRALAPERLLEKLQISGTDTWARLRTE